MRDTFMKVAQSLIVKRQLVNEKILKEKMIHSVMPPKVADWLMNEGNTDGIDDAVFLAAGGQEPILRISISAEKLYP
jgi:adenylate cyclase 9